jgi:hypothetical protein
MKKNYKNANLIDNFTITIMPLINVFSAKNSIFVIDYAPI